MASEGRRDFCGSEEKEENGCTGKGDEMGKSAELGKCQVRLFGVSSMAVAISWDFFRFFGRS